MAGLDRVRLQDIEVNGSKCPKLQHVQTTKRLRSVSFDERKPVVKRLDFEAVDKGGANFCRLIIGTGAGSDFFTWAYQKQKNEVRVFGVVPMRSGGYGGG
jgi:hypothetical protein